MTTDLWTEERTNTHYITVTVHYILGWKLLNRVLATREIMGVKTCDLYCIFYCNWQIPAKKTQPGVGGNGSHSSGIGMGLDFSPVFSRDWDGTGFFFCGSGTGVVWICTPVSPSRLDMPTALMIRLPFVSSRGRRSAVSLPPLHLISSLSPLLQTVPPWDWAVLILYSVFVSASVYHVWQSISSTKFQSEGSLRLTHFTLASFSCGVSPLRHIVALMLDSFLMREYGYVGLGMIAASLSFFLAFGMDQNTAPVSTTSLFSINYP